MAVTLDDTRLWQTQEDKSVTKGEVRVDSIYGDDSDQSLLTGLESQEKLSYNGIATGNRLALQSKYSNDPNVALAEWVAEMEAFIDATQGTGYALEDVERGDTKNVVGESFGWTRESGEKYQVSWDISFIWGEGMMPDRTTTPDQVNPSDTWSLNGEQLPGVQSYRQSKSQQVENVPVALAEPGENIVKSNSGAQRTIVIQGDVTDRIGLNTFDDRIQALVGQDNIVEFQSAFPGRTKDVMVREFEGTRMSGLTRIGEYVLELVEGRT